MSEELDNAAAEYVLGTLPAHERTRFVEAMQRDPALLASVRKMQAQFFPLDDTAAALLDQSSACAPENQWKRRRRSQYDP